MVAEKPLQVSHGCNIVASSSTSIQSMQGTCTYTSPIHSSSCCRSSTPHLLTVNNANAKHHCLPKRRYTAVSMVHAMRVKHAVVCNSSYPSVACTYICRQQWGRGFVKRDVIHMSLSQRAFKLPAAEIGTERPFCRPTSSCSCSARLALRDVVVYFDGARIGLAGGRTGGLGSACSAVC